MCSAPATLPARLLSRRRASGQPSPSDVGGGGVPGARSGPALRSGPRAHVCVQPTGGRWPGPSGRGGEGASAGRGRRRGGASASSSPPRERLRRAASTGRGTPAEDPAVAAWLGLIVPFAAALRHGVAFFTRQRHRHARLSPSVRRGSRWGEAAGRQHLALSPGGPLLAVCWGAREGENSITPPPSRSQGQISAAVFQPPSSTPELSPRAS